MGLCLVGQIAAAATVNSFTNGAGDGQWGTPGNWSLGTVPVVGHQARILSGQTARLRDSAEATNLVLQGGATLVFEIGASGIAPLILAGGATLDPNSAIVVDGSAYAALDGYLPLIKDGGTFAGYDSAKVSFLGLEGREPATVMQADGLWLRLTAPPALSAQLCSLIPPSRVAPDHRATTFAATRALQPTVSAWAVSFNEAHVMDTQLSQEVSGDGGVLDPVRSWSLRVGRGGQLYSLRTAALGETVPPSWRSGGFSYSPWNDEVWQGVAVSTALNKPDAVPPSPYFIHHSGVYLRDPIQSEPFFSPQVASHLDAQGRSFTTVNWGQQAHTQIYADGTPDNDWRSHLLIYTCYRDLGQGVIEVTMGYYNFGPDVLDWQNMPWGGVRRTSLENAFLSYPGGTTWTAPLTASWAETASLSTTGGWMAYSASETGQAPAMAFVFGRDNSPRLPDQKSESLIRWGYAGGKDSYQSGEANWRNYFVTTIVRRFNLTRGRGVWSRYYLAFGDTVAEVAARVAARGLAAGTELRPMDFTESGTPLIGYSFSGSGSGFRIQRDSAAPRFHLYAHPVNGSFPLFEIVAADGARHLTWDPYATGVVKTYDGTLAGIRLLGYALRASDANRAGTDFAYAPLADIFAAAAGNYVAAGESLVARLDSPLECWRIEHFGDKHGNGTAADTHDHDADGAANLLEYALGGDPRLGDGRSILPSITGVNRHGSPLLAFTYRRRTDAAVRSLVYMVQRSSSLQPGSWSTVGVTETAVAPIDAEFESVTAGIAGSEPAFVRLTVEISE